MDCIRRGHNEGGRHGEVRTSVEQGDASHACLPSPTNFTVVEGGRHGEVRSSDFGERTETTLRLVRQSTRASDEGPDARVDCWGQTLRPLERSGRPLPRSRIACQTSPRTGGSTKKKKEKKKEGDPCAFKQTRRLSSFYGSSAVTRVPAR